jgi:hypothetical protein
MVYLDSKGAWPLLHCRADFLWEPGDVLGVWAGIMALRAVPRGARFVSAKMWKLVVLSRLGVVLLALRLARIYWDFEFHQEALKGNCGGATRCWDIIGSVSPITSIYV